MPKAIRFDEYGDTGVYYLADIDTPEPGSGQVVVDVRAAAINPGETGIRSGSLKDMYPATFPSGQGTDLAGVVSAVGPDVTAWQPGDEVLGWSWDRNSHAEVCLVPADQLVAKPAGLSWEVAGTLGVAGTTAWATVAAVGAGDGDTVAVTAAAGGVGSLAVQLLAVKGAKAIGIASEANSDWLRSKGATPLAYGDDLADRLGEQHPDALIDCFGGGYVKMGVELGIAKERIDTIIDFPAAQEYGVKAEGSAEATSQDVVRQLADLAASGRLEVTIARTYPLTEVAEAFRELEERHTRGKIVLVP